MKKITSSIIYIIAISILTSIITYLVPLLLNIFIGVELVLQAIGTMCLTILVRIIFSVIDKPEILNNIKNNKFIDHYYILGSIESCFPRSYRGSFKNDLLEMKSEMKARGCPRWKFIVWFTKECIGAIFWGIIIGNLKSLYERVFQTGSNKSDIAED